MKSQFEPTTVQPRDGAADANAPTRSPRPLAAARRLAPVLAAGIAAASGWLAATSHADLPVFWLVSAVAAAAAVWAGLRRPAGRRARADSGMALYNRGGLLAHGQILLATCRAERRDLTLAVFDCNDLLEARTIYGSRTTRLLVASIVRKLTLLAGGEGLAARTGPTQFAIAMPLSRDKAAQAIERVLGNPARFELDGKNEIVLVPQLMVESVAEDGSLERLFNALCRGLSRVQEEEAQRHRYLQRQRERHSRPMPIQAPAPQPVARRAPPRLDPDRVIPQQIPNTIPMPLSMR